MEYFEHKHNRTSNIKDLNPLQGSGETILFIDDDETLIEMTRILLKFYGYTIFTAYDEIEGISVYNTNKKQINIIVCSLTMPTLSGSSMVQKLLEIDPATKILIMSRSIKEESLAQYLVLGKIEFLQKPFLIENLLVSLKFLLHPK
jgi:DNA-binding response OmpR family regulator